MRQGRSKEALAPLASAVKASPASPERQLAPGPRLPGRRAGAQRPALAACRASPQAGPRDGTRGGARLLADRRRAAFRSRDEDRRRGVSRRGGAEAARAGSVGRPRRPDVVAGAGPRAGEARRPRGRRREPPARRGGGQGGAEDYLQLARCHADLAKVGVEGASDQARAAVREALRHKADLTELRELAGDLAYAAVRATPRRWNTTTACPAPSATCAGRRSRAAVWKRAGPRTPFACWKGESSTSMPSRASSWGERWPGWGGGKRRPKR